MIYDYLVDEIVFNASGRMDRHTIALTCKKMNAETMAMYYCGPRRQKTLRCEVTDLHPPALATNLRFALDRHVSRTTLHEAPALIFDVCLDVMLRAGPFTLLLVQCFEALAFLKQVAMLRSGFSCQYDVHWDPGRTSAALARQLFVGLQAEQEHWLKSSNAGPCSEKESKAVVADFLQSLYKVFAEH